MSFLTRRFNVWSRLLLAAGGLFFTESVQAREFVLGGAHFELREVTRDVDVYFTSMRLNRALNQWNVEVTLSNRTAQPLNGPLVLVVDSFSGTSGPLAADGSSAGQSFYDLGAQSAGGRLPAGGQTVPRTLALGFVAGGSPQIVSRIFAGSPDAAPALGFVRSLDSLGQPLPGVSVEETGPEGAKEKTTEEQFGLVTLGQSPGDYVWKFHREGLLPVWRRAVLRSNWVEYVPYPRLPVRAAGTDISPLSGGMVTNHDISIQIPAGAVSQESPAYLTPLDGQSLPGLLPLGWSPLQAFWLEFASLSPTPLAATLTPWGAFNANEGGAVVRFDEDRRGWEVVQLFASSSTNPITATLPGPGAYAVVVPDTGTTAPPAPQLGTLLAAAAAVFPDNESLSAGGSVTPPARPASLVSEEVTATAIAHITNASGPLPSGLALRCDFHETYRLADGTRRVTPPYENFVIGYRRPGFGASNVLHAAFPVRPLVLFEAAELDEAVVSIDLLPPSEFGGAVLTTEGGLATGGRFRILAGTGALESPQAALLRERAVSDFTNVASGLTVLGAFDLSIGAVSPAQPLSLQLSNAPSNAWLVLARVLNNRQAYGLTPVARFVTDAQGQLTSLETNAVERLPGITGPGQYLLAQVSEPQTLVRGVARNAQGQAAGGLVVKLAPWTTLSQAPDGKFLLLAPAGTNQVLVADGATGDVGTAPLVIVPGQASATLEAAAAASGPRVVTIIPEDQAERVARVTSVTIHFSRPINPATLLNGGAQLWRGSNLVAATLTLNLANTRLTLLPTAELEPDTRYTVALSLEIVDSTGRPLEGPRDFSFTTAPLAARAGGAQLIVYEPGATNIPPDLLARIPGYEPGMEPGIVVVHGTPGCADPRVPVIVVNEATSETATVLSQSDGSFATFVAAQAQDFISATFVNLNGSRIYVPVNRQLFDDGSVGLYAQGGTLTAAGSGGPIQITVPAGAVPTRTKFKLESLNLDDLTMQLNQVMPSNGVVAGQALNLRLEGALPTLPLQVRFPIDLRDFDYPEDESPTNVAAVLTAVRDTQAVTSFEIMDQLRFTPQSPEGIVPAGGPRAQGDNDQLAAGFLDTSVGLILPALGPTVGAGIQIGFNQLLVPLLFGPRPVVIKGKAGALPYDLALGMQQAGLTAQVVAALNLQTGIQMIDVPVGLAMQLGLKNPVSERLGPAMQLPGQIISIAAYAFQQQMIQNAQPLSGAFVSVSMTPNVVGVIQGRLRPGMVYATTDREGHFLTVAPAAGANYLITCTHPLFQEVQTQPVNPIKPVSTALGGWDPGDLSLAGAVYKNFFFFVPNLDQAPPSISVANLPVLPAPGQTCDVFVDASQPALAPELRVSISDVGRTNLLTGLVETNVQYSLTQEQTTTTGTRTRWSGKVTVNKPVLVTFKIIANFENGLLDTIQNHAIPFIGTVPVTPGDIPPPDTNDVRGPLVMEVQPVENGYLDVNGAISLVFNKAIDPFVTNNVAGIDLSGPGNIPPPVVHLSRDQQSLTLQYPGLLPDSTFRLTLSGASIRDLAGQPLDQRPTTPEADSFSMTLRTPPSPTANLPGLDSGRGAVIRGDRLYALDFAAQGSHLNIYDVSIPLQPRLLSRTRLYGQPRDLAVVPQYHFKRTVHKEVEVSDIVAVVGGDLDALIDTAQGTTVSVRGQYLWVFAAGDGTAPVLLAQPIVSYRVSSAATTVRWAPPYLVYQEYGQDVQLLGFVNLQELIIGYQSNPSERLVFPTPDKRTPQNSGIDRDGNGDYVGDQEMLPLPDAAPVEFYGKRFNYVLQNTTQKIMDFSATPGAAIVGITTREGYTLDTKGGLGARLPAMYRTLAFGGLPLNLDDPVSGMVPFEAGAFPRFVSVFDGLPIVKDGVPTTIAAALVSLQPDGDGQQKLAVIDISQPLAPVLLSKVPIPESLLGGSLGLVQMNHGQLEVSGGQNVVLLDPSALGVSNAPPGQLHPAILGAIPRAGTTTRSAATTDFGVRATADGSRTAVVQSPPELSFVSFPAQGSLVDPTAMARQSEATVAQIMAGARTAGALAPARAHAAPQLGLDSELEGDPRPALHYYVLVVAPGGAGKRIELGLESLNPAGRPLSNPGYGFAPVRAVSATTQDAIGQRPRPNCGADIRALPAFRLSDDPASPFFNRYLSRPFVLVTEKVTPDELFQYRNGLVDREVLTSGAQLRAFIEPGQVTHPNAGPVIGPFAARVDPNRKMIYPISVAVALTVNRDYLVGDNPPPAGGGEGLPGTYGMILAHSGELRTDATDLQLPSPRMPIRINRAIGNQDLYEGPFGVGWDFNYNQRLTELSPDTFPAGLQMPLLARGNADASEIAGSQDVLFQTGAGGTILFQWISTNMPAGYVGDPLVQEFEYARYVSDYYLPQKRQGVFDLLVKFKDGRFERLTPEGMRYRYAPNGRLETIIDRFPANRHELQYDRNGWLVRIDDRSVSGPRYVEFGYYRHQSTDPDFVSGLDLDTNNPYLEGKIGRLRDYAGRDVLYEYSDDGFLIRKRGVEVAGENGGFSGRALTVYAYQNCHLTSIAATANATPVLSADNALNSTGKPVAQSGTGFENNVALHIPVENAADKMAGQISSVDLPDGSTTKLQFDPMGHPTSVEVTGPGADPAKVEQKQDEDTGLMAYLKFPEGRIQRFNYDTNNPVFRSRGNLKSLQVEAGPRGGADYTETYNYDPRYNLPSGIHTDANGFAITYQLSGDGRYIASVQHDTAGTESFTYNERGQLTQRVDCNGVETSATFSPATGFLETARTGDAATHYTYDGSIPAQLGAPSGIQPPRGAAYTTKYNNKLQEVEIQRGADVQQLAYDELGRMTTYRHELGDGKALVIEREVDVKGFVKRQVINGVEVDGAVAPLEYVYEPDERSRVAVIHHPGGTLQKFTYNALGQLIKMQLGSYTEESKLDLHGNVLETRRGGDLVSTAEYDGLDRAIRSTIETGTRQYVTERTYFPGGQLKSQVVTDPVYGVVNETEVEAIDALGRTVRSTVVGDAVPTRTDTTVYETNRRTITGPRQTVTFEWDAAGRPTRFAGAILETLTTTDGNGNVEREVRHETGATYADNYTYDPLDHRESQTDNLGLLAEFVARTDGQVIETRNARHHATQIEYSALGEVLRRTRADGLEFQRRYNDQRQLQFTGDPAAGFDYAYDELFRQTRRTLRNGNAITTTAFDARNQPTHITIPGGTITMDYDRQGHPLTSVVQFNDTTYQTTVAYDAMGQAREVNYEQSGGSPGVTKFTYDKAGPLVRAEFQEAGATFAVTYGYRDDQARNRVTYPSGYVVQEERDDAGRLTGITGPTAPIATITDWQGNNQPKQVDFGGVLRMDNVYDARGRITGARYVRTPGGARQAEMRYQYDGANNVEMRQFLHRAGKTDNYSYDPGERLSRAQIGGFPLSGVADVSRFAYQRTYHYHSTGLDYLQTGDLTGPGPVVPAFATNWTAHDGFLLPAVVDGGTRQADAMGQVSGAQLWVRPAAGSAPVAVPALLQHNGLGQLTRIERSDGVVVENFYQPGGLRYARRVTQNGVPVDYRSFVYDDKSRLLEEYDRTSEPPVLIGRYFYLDTDAPVAADLRDNGGVLQRFYFLRDHQKSVVAVADHFGVVQERIWYDPHGQPVIEPQDAVAPVVKRILAGSGGTLLLEFTEPVSARIPDLGLQPGIRRLTPDYDGLVTGAPGHTELPESVAGFAPNTVVIFTPDTAGTNPVTLTLAADRLTDDWNNPVQAQTFTLTPTGAVGTVYYTAPDNPVTDSGTVARSTVGSPFLFHGQYFDYDTGLVYLRARFYDPFAGMFLEPDPLGYEDSVNLYAGFGNNPSSLRDPSGLISKGVTRIQYYRFLERSGYNRKQLRLINEVHSTLTRRGMSDLEIAAHIRVMSQGFRDGFRYELAIRKANNPQARMQRTEEGYQGKPEIVVAKSDLVTALVTHGGKTYTGDLDGLYLLSNGQPMTLAQTRKFQMDVNREIARLSPGFRSITDLTKQQFHANEFQQAYQHGMSFNLPQEYGTPNFSMEGHAVLGIAHWDNLELKMKKGTGEAFAFGFAERGAALNFNENVNVNKMLSLHEQFYTDVLLKPSHRGADIGAIRRREAQWEADGGRYPTRMFPTTFYGHHYGE